MGCTNSVSPAFVGDGGSHGTILSDAQVRYTHCVVYMPRIPASHGGKPAFHPLPPSSHGCPRAQRQELARVYDSIASEGCVTVRLHNHARVIGSRARAADSRARNS